MTKRVKLKVLRNRLPDVDLLWAVKEQDGREQCTIARLIADVNEAIPLEGGDWTLDQYVVEVDGFECLHYQHVSQILKDGDSITIRPLATPDVKARRLGGRTQITGEGFHILDGVPYGMQPNQRPARPGILIPSRKRRRPEMEEEDYADEEGMTVAEIEDDDELLEHVNGGASYDELITGGADSYDTDERPRKKQKTVRFNFVKDIPGFDVEEDDEDEDEDDDFDPNVIEGAVAEDESDSEEESDNEEDDDLEEEDEESDESDDSSDSDSSSDISSISSDESSSSDESVADRASPPVIVSGKQLDNAAKINGFHQISNPIVGNNTVSAQGAHTSIANGAHEGRLHKNHNEIPNEVHTGVPYNGTKATKDRNNRRRTHERVIKYVRELLGGKATKEECTKWLKDNPERSKDLTTRAKQAQISLADDFGDEDSFNEIYNTFKGFSDDSDQARAEDHPAIATEPSVTSNGNLEDGLGTELEETLAPPNGSISETMLQDVTRNADDFTRRRKELLDAIASGGVLNSADDEPVSILDAEETAAHPKKRMQIETESPASKKARLNIDGSRRAIFGALGVRTPKTQEDAERLRAKFAATAKQKAAIQQPADTQKDAPEEVDPLSDAWRSKIRLMAVDCDNPEIQLSEPPYPFKQRWDPSQKRKDPGWWANGGKQKKKKARNSYGKDLDTYDEDYEVTYDEVSFLIYDEPEPDNSAEPANDDADEDEYVYGEEEFLEYVEETQDLGGNSAASNEFVNDLPSLPADMSTLPNLEPGLALPGAVIAFKQLECNQATGWQPTMSAHRTAKILNRGNEGAVLDVELAMRDREVKDVRYDAEGNRLYEKFEMAVGGDGEEDDVDDGFREVQFSDMVEPKLVKAAIAVEA